MSCGPGKRLGAMYPGKAGASAARQYEHRAARHLDGQLRRIDEDRAWREEIRVARPVLGRLATAVTARPTLQPEPPQVRNWAQGHSGEVVVGAFLDRIPGIVALHDRRVPGSPANIDHIAVTPTGVWVIDTKRYVSSSIAYKDVGGWTRREPRLFVGGRDRTTLVDAMAHQATAAATAAGTLLAGVPVRSALCFVEGTWGLFPKAFKVRGVVVCWPTFLTGLLSRPGELDPGRMGDIAAVLAHRLRPA
jgi:hypothetical protein